MLSDVNFDRTLVITSRLTPSLMRWGHSMAVFQRSPWRPKKTKLFWQNFFQVAGKSLKNKRGLGPFLSYQADREFWWKKSRPFSKQLHYYWSSTARPCHSVFSWVDFFIWIMNMSNTQRKKKYKYSLYSF